MSPTFLIALVVALAAVFYWRVVVMIAIAVVLAFVLMGISTVSSVMAGQEEGHSIVVAPASPGQQRDVAGPGSDQPPGPEDAPPQEQPSPPR
jgi:hypothetical protein